MRAGSHGRLAGGPLVVAARREHVREPETFTKCPAASERFRPAIVDDIEQRPTVTRGQQRNLMLVQNASCHELPGAVMSKFMCLVSQHVIWPD